MTLSSTITPLARLDGLRSLVANTPLLELDLSYRGVRRRLYAKAENLNMTGSVKDRMALHILARGYATGTLAPGAPIYEATSGNTGISFAALGKALGHPVTIFIPDWVSAERIDLIRSFGATIRLVSREEGGFVGAIEMAEHEAARSRGVFLPRQFANADNAEAHEHSTGPEVWQQLSAERLVPDALVAGVGTGGTIMGAGRWLRRMRPDVKLFPVEPASAPTLTTGHQVGAHRIQGISDEFIPPIVDLAYLDDILAVDDGDAIVMARRLAAELGLGVGISAGANLAAALTAVERLGPDPVVVTVFPDSNKKYLSTDLLRPEPIRDHHVSAAVRFHGFRAMGRVCGLCAAPVNPVDALGRGSGRLAPRGR